MSIPLLWVMWQHIMYLCVRCFQCRELCGMCMWYNLVSIYICNIVACRSQWPRGLRRRSSAARLLTLWVRIPPGAWKPVSCECCVLSCRGLCDELITRPEESYRLWCFVECDLETSWMWRLWPTGGCCAPQKNIYIYIVAWKMFNIKKTITVCCTSDTTEHRRNWCQGYIDRT